MKSVLTSLVMFALSAFVTMAMMMIQTSRVLAVYGFSTVGVEAGLQLQYRQMCVAGFGSWNCFFSGSSWCVEDSFSLAGV